uniref:uncharacterized protein isoform X3 n=1 Tax=Pristiophorus japonicus TaxID=55135 RepID=UPI00398E5D98
MSLCWCCCPSDPDSAGEREPLMSPQSARQLRRPTEVMAMKDGRIAAKLVNVADLDQCFADIVDTFNHQQENYITLCESIRLLKECCQCNTLVDCFQRLQLEHWRRYWPQNVSGHNPSASATRVCRVIFQSN